jgi:diguanylate cyclase (GGDEF)-like protein
MASVRKEAVAVANMDSSDHQKSPEELLKFSWQIKCSEPNKALVAAREAERLAEINKDAGLADLARLQSGWCLVYQGQPDKAFVLFLELVPGFEQQQNSEYLARLFNGLGMAQQGLSHFADSLSSYLKARDYAKSSSDPQTLLLALCNMASVHIELDQCQDALQLLHDIESQGEDQIPEPIHTKYLLLMGKALSKIGNREKAEQYLLHSIECGRRYRYRNLVFNGLLTLAPLEAEKGNSLQAQQLIEEAVGEALLMADYLKLANAYYVRSEINSAKNETSDAIENLQKALFFFNGKVTTTRLQAHIRLSEIFQVQHQFELALQHLYCARELEKTIFQREASSQVKALQVALENEKKQLESEYQRIKNHELKNQNRQLELINLIGRDIASSLNLTHIIKTLYQKFNQSIGVNVCGIALVDKDKSRVEFRHFLENGEQAEPFTIPMDRQVSFATHCVRTEDLIFSNNALTDSYQLFGDHKEYVAQGSLIYVPMFDQERLFAVFTVQVAEINGFNDDDVELVKSVSAFLSVAIQNALTHEKVHALTEEIIREKKEIEHLALHDRLTGLTNRIGLESEFDFLTSNRPDPFALVYIDLDNFKPINDRYGHEFGDDVLKILAERMRRTIRHTDIAARIGGDEFIILLKKVTRYEDAEHIVEQIRDRIRSPIMLGKNKLSLTASLGVALYPHHGSNLKTLMRCADEAMYEVKNVSKDGISYLRH